MDAPKLTTGTEILAAAWAWSWVVLLSRLGRLFGLSGHMGSRALVVAETLLSRKTAKWRGLESINPPATPAPPEAKP